MKLEDGYKTDKGKGSSTTTGYTVEAMCSSDPQMVNGKIYDKTWRGVPFSKAEFGVPGSKFHPELAEHGLLTYQQAQALRWWFHASGSNESGFGLSMETRIVKHTLEQTYSVKAVSWHKHILGEDRSSIMPDWGEKDEPE